MLAIPVIFLYCLMTGATNPVLRATLMAVVFLLAYFLKRDADIYNSLSLAAIFILSFNPLQLFDIGFQLSFASVLAIVLIYFNLKKESRGKGPLFYKLSLSLILAGALGNLIDRLYLGYVIDFLDFRIWPVFNIADSAITIGVLLLAIEIISTRPKSTV